MRIRVKYNVSGKVRFISHLDLMRVFFRACVKKNIPVAVSQGFSPHLKLSFGHPLSVGMSGCSEMFDMYVTQPVDVQSVKVSLQDAVPEGIEIKDVFTVPEGVPSLAASLNRAVYKVKIPPDKESDMAERIKKYLNPLLKKMEFDNGQLVIDVPIGQNGSVRPVDILKSLWPELGPEELKLWQVQREEMYNEGNFNQHIG